MTHAEEFHHCPACGRRTRHRVARERVLAPVMWCQGCFHVRLGDDAHLTGARQAFISAPLAAAE